MLWNFRFLTLGKPSKVTCQIGESGPHPPDSSPSCEFRPLQLAAGKQWRQRISKTPVTFPLGNRQNNAVSCFLSDCKRRRRLIDGISTFQIILRRFACLSLYTIGSVKRLSHRTFFFHLLYKLFSKTPKGGHFVKTTSVLKFKTAMWLS